MRSLPCPALTADSREEPRRQNMITVTGNLADDPHTFRTGDGPAGAL
jgi:hypothetical protein